jgi:hypothetical protein
MKKPEFQIKHTRNANDWNVTTDDTGRICLTANNGGVKQRCALLVTRLSRAHRALTVDTLTRSLKRLHKSYNEGDVKYGLAKLAAIGVVREVNNGWKITSTGVRLWQSSL